MGPTRQTVAGEISSTGFLLLLACTLAAASAGARAEAMPAPFPAASELTPKEIVQEMVQNELKAENDDFTHWRFRKSDTVSGVTKTWDVIQTRSGEIQRLIAIDGHPLTEEEQAAEQARLQSFLENAQAQQQRKKSASSDFKQEQSLMKMLPNALTYQYVGEEDGLIHLTFTPNPNFRASTREAQVFHHMSGDLWINKSNMRLADLRGRLTSRVEFGWGLLGHLDEGGTFNVKQEEVAKDHWDITLLQTDITGKILFFKTIAVHEKLVESDYQRVPDDLTLREAAALLQHNGSSSALVSASDAHSNS